MSPEPSQHRNIRQALARFSCLDRPATLTEAEQQTIRKGIQQFNEWSDYQTLGICADSLAEAKAATEAYVAVLSRAIDLKVEEQAGAVFLKFNTLNGMWYLDGYTGTSRGVLITFHASEPEFDFVNGTYGPFPLNLFS